MTIMTKSRQAGIHGARAGAENLYLELGKQVLMAQKNLYLFRQSQG